MLSIFIFILALQTRIVPQQIAGGIPAPNPIQVQRISERELVVGYNCTKSSPCVHRMRGITFVFDQGWTIRSLGGGAGTVTFALNYSGSLRYKLGGLASVFCSWGPSGCYPTWGLPDIDHLMLAEWSTDTGGVFASVGTVYTLPLAVYQPGAIETIIREGAPKRNERCVPPALRMDASPRLWICIGDRWRTVELMDW